MARCFQAAAWIAIAAIALLSVVPPSFRPTTSVPRKLEHLLIFGIAGLALSLAYRASPLYQIIGMIVFAGALEVAQYMDSRSPRARERFRYQRNRRNYWSDRRTPCL